MNIEYKILVSIWNTCEYRVLVRYILVEYEYGFERAHEYLYSRVYTRSIPCIAMTHAAKELVWIRSFVSEIFGSMGRATILRVDNQSAIAMAHHDVFHPRTKHIAIRYHFIREVVAQGLLTLKWVETDLNIADIFTKALDTVKTDRFSKGLGLLSA